uniref:non-specific serine/threonine protein kinase n=1 Tax=Sciurus vulgaris TaxID=55149 RepID=A0A8D2DAD6_SCIVU
MYSKSSQTSVVLQGPSSCDETAFMDRYEVLRAIGCGGSSQVKLARHLLTGVEVAVKVLSKKKQDLSRYSEVNVMMGLEHPNVIQLFQVIETGQHIYIVMEHVGGGQLLDHIQSGGMREEEARRLFRQIVYAVGHCHKKDIAHRDLKVENIMVDARGNIKLLDFGISVKFRPGQKLRGFQGTLPYLAPEIIQREEYEAPLVDVWSLGVILYYMLSGTHPFRKIFPWDLATQIVEARYYIPDHIPVQARRLIRKMLTKNPVQRPTVEEILQHPWLREGEEHSPASQRSLRSVDSDIMGWASVTRTLNRCMSQAGSGSLHQFQPGAPLDPPGHQESPLPPPARDIRDSFSWDTSPALLFSVPSPMLLGWQRCSFKN